MEAHEYPLEINSPEFGHMGYIPVKYTCDGENISPPLQVKNIPATAQSMVLIVDDPDAPKGTYNHWLVWNITPEETIAENVSPGMVGENSAGKHEYIGPCPPKEGVHRYFFTIHILNAMLDLDGNVDRVTLERAMDSHIQGSATLVGLYRRAL